MKFLKWLLAVALSTNTLLAARIETCQVPSPSMSTNVPATVILPDTYAAGKPLPVIYLLHGYGQNHASWLKDVPITASLADRYQVILVCADGGIGSWYWDSPVDPKFRYETHVIHELIPYIDAHYSTVGRREGRAITGLSMGGHGALYLGFRHQDIFGAAGSMSGGVDICPFPEEWDIAKRLGPEAEQPERWREYSVLGQTQRLTKNGLAIIIDCGTGDFFLDANRKLHKTLLYLRVPHDYIERPGGHLLPYWNNAIEYQVLFFSKFFAGVPAKP